MGGSLAAWTCMQCHRTHACMHACMQAHAHAVQTPRQVTLLTSALDGGLQAVARGDHGAQLAGGGRGLGAGGAAGGLRVRVRGMVTVRVRQQLVHMCSPLHRSCDGMTWPPASCGHSVEQGSTPTCWICADVAAPEALARTSLPRPVMRPCSSRRLACVAEGGRAASMSACQQLLCWRHRGLACRGWPAGAGHRQ